jgi:hypothetical protein
VQSGAEAPQSTRATPQTIVLIAKVLRPVWGVGRYDGTTFTGVGAINTNHGGVITISTAPVMPPDTKEGGAVETRGGFMIQPSLHAREQNETSPQVMVIGPKDRTAARLEGTPPLFEGYVNLSYYPDRPANSYHAQVRIDDSDWEDVPEIVGKADDAFRPAYLEGCFARTGKPRTITKGVTAVRLLFPEYDAKLVAQDLASETSEYTLRSISMGTQRLKGKVTLAPSRPPSGKCMVNFYVDGAPISTLNHPPYEYEWDTATVPNGFHVIEIERAPDGGSPVVERREVVVGN